MSQYDKNVILKCFKNFLKYPGNNRFSTDLLVALAQRLPLISDNKTFLKDLLSQLRKKILDKNLRHFDLNLTYNRMWELLTSWTEEEISEHTEFLHKKEELIGQAIAKQRTIKAQQELGGNEAELFPQWDIAHVKSHIESGLASTAFQTKALLKIFPVPLEDPIPQEHIEIARLLLQQKNYFYEDQDIQRLLFFLCQWIKEGSWEVPNKFGNLHEIVKLLLTDPQYSKNFNIDGIGTPLMMYCESEDIDIKVLEAFLQNPMLVDDIESENLNGALHILCKNEKAPTTALKLFLDNTKLISSKNAEGATPFQLSLQFNLRFACLFIQDQRLNIQEEIDSFIDTVLVPLAEIYNVTYHGYLFPILGNATGKELPGSLPETTQSILTMIEQLIAALLLQQENNSRKSTTEPERSDAFSFDKLMNFFSSSSKIEAELFTSHLQVLLKNPFFSGKSFKNVIGDMTIRKTFIFQHYQKLKETQSLLNENINHNANVNNRESLFANLTPQNLSGFFPWSN